MRYLPHIDRQVDLCGAKCKAQSNRWLRMASLRLPRYGGKMVAYGDRIYMLGGGRAACAGGTDDSTMVSEEAMRHNTRRYFSSVDCTNRTIRWKCTI